MVKNALEASGCGDMVRTGLGVKKNRVEFWVRKPRPMPREIQLQVFQRSFSTKGKGRGLGTYSMKFLSERYLHGTVRFESSEEEGTVFRASFPIAFPGYHSC
jgi:signal transduction histidine kinase